MIMLSNRIVLIMRSSLLLLSLLLLLIPILNINGEEDEEFPVPESMKNAENVMSFKPPDLTEEESHSTRLSAAQSCDGCMAVAYILTNSFLHLHHKRYAAIDSRAPESEIIELVEKACEPKNFEDYGIKAVNGQNKLSGPGLEAANEPGMMQGGGRWPVRLATMCGEFLNELDEIEMYEALLDHGDDALMTLLCKNEEVGGQLNSCCTVNTENKDEL